MKIKNIKNYIFLIKNVIGKDLQKYILFKIAINIDLPSSEQELPGLYF